MACGGKIDLHAYQRTFPDRAAAYFRGTGLNAPQLAVAFGVSERTAQNWLEGLVAPRGPAIAVIATRDPKGFARHFGAAA
jgi:DNA-binding transcriptional regulator YiaG